MADEEFGTLQEGAVVNVIGTIVIVLVILWLALHSPRIILAVFLNLAVGFAVTAALGLMMVGALNLISVAFAVLFVGLGVDFGIQFAVRYRSERFKSGDLYSALRQHRREGRRAADARRRGGRGGLPVVFPDRLQRRLRARPDRRHRHADRLHHQHHRAAGAAHHPASAGRRGGDRLWRARAGRPLPGASPHPGDRRHASWSRSADCRCSTISPSISIRSICAARPSSWSRRSSTCGPIRRSAPTRSTCWCRSPATSTRSPIGFARFLRSTRSRRSPSSSRTIRTASSR